MSDLEARTAGGSGLAAEEEEVRRLLAAAGPRAEVPAEDLARIKTAFRAAWEEHLRQGRARRSFASGPRLLALAAALVAAVGLGWWIFGHLPAAGAGPVATVAGLTGQVTARAPGEDGTPRPIPFTVGGEVPAGAELETAGGQNGAGRAALRLRDGSSLRLDAGSRVRLVSASEVQLVRGAVYLDSGGGPRRSRVVVHTPLGVARELGTQFEVRLLGAGAGLRVRVREGTVRVEGDQGAYSTGAGTELTLRADGSATRRPIARHGSPWSWVLAAAPPLQIEGLTLRQFLDQVARETGWTIRYEDARLAESAESIQVHGSLGRLTPEQAPGVVLPGAGLRGELSGGTLLIRDGHPGEVEEPPPSGTFRSPR